MALNAYKNMKITIIILSLILVIITFINLQLTIEKNKQIRTLELWVSAYYQECGELFLPRQSTIKEQNYYNKLK